MAAPRRTSVDSPPEGRPSSGPPVACAIGDIVLVHTASPIDGQRDHAAIVTRLLAGGAINAMVLPAFGLPYPVSAVAAEAQAAPGALYWLPRP